MPSLPICFHLFSYASIYLLLCFNETNKQLRIAEEKVKGAGYTKKSARGAYFPGIDFTGSYMYNQKSISLLESDQYLPTKTFDLASQEYKYNVVTNPATGQPILNNGQPIPSTVAMIPKEAFEFDAFILPPIKIGFARFLPTDGIKE